MAREPPPRRTPPRISERVPARRVPQERVPPRRVPPERGGWLRVEKESARVRSAIDRGLIRREGQQLYLAKPLGELTASEFKLVKDIGFDITQEQYQQARGVESAIEKGIVEREGEQLRLAKPLGELTEPEFEHIRTIGFDVTKEQWQQAKEVGEAIDIGLIERRVGPLLPSPEFARTIRSFIQSRFGRELPEPKRVEQYVLAKPLGEVTEPEFKLLESIGFDIEREQYQRAKEIEKAIKQGFIEREGEELRLVKPLSELTESEFGFVKEIGFDIEKEQWQQSIERQQATKKAIKKKLIRRIDGTLRLRKPLGELTASEVELLNKAGFDISREAHITALEARQERRAFEEAERRVYGAERKGLIERKGEKLTLARPVHEYTESEVEALQRIGFDIKRGQWQQAKEIESAISKGIVERKGEKLVLAKPWGELTEPERRLLEGRFGFEAVTPSVKSIITMFHTTVQKSLERGVRYGLIMTMVNTAKQVREELSTLTTEELWDIISTKPSEEAGAEWVRHQEATKEYISRFFEPGKTYSPFAFEAVQRAPPGLAKMIAKMGETPSLEALRREYTEAYEKTWETWQAEHIEHMKPFEMPEIPTTIAPKGREPWSGAGFYVLPTGVLTLEPATWAELPSGVSFQPYLGFKPPDYSDLLKRERQEAVERISEYALESEKLSERVESTLESWGAPEEAAQFVAGGFIGWAEDLWEGVSRLVGHEEWAPSKHPQPVWKFRSGIAWKPGFEAAYVYEAGTLPGAKLPSEPWKEVGKVGGWLWATAGLISATKLAARGAFRFGERFIGKPVMARMAPWQRAAAEVYTQRVRELGPAIEATFLGEPTKLITRRAKGKLVWHPLRGKPFVKTTVPGEYVTVHREGLLSWVIEPVEVLLKRPKPYWWGPTGEMLGGPPEHYLWRLAGIRGTVRRAGPLAMQDVEIMIRNLGRISQQEAARIPSLLDISRARILGITRTKGWYRIPQLGAPQKGLFGYPYTPRVSVRPSWYVGPSRIAGQASLLAMQDIETMWRMGSRAIWETGTKITTMFRKGFPGEYIRTETLLRPSEVFYPAPVFGAEELGLMWRPGALLKTRGWDLILGKEPATQKVARAVFGTYEPRWTQMALTGQRAAYRIRARGVGILPEFPGMAEISFETYPYMFEQMPPAALKKIFYLPRGVKPSPWRFGVGEAIRPAKISDILGEYAQYRMPGFYGPSGKAGAGWFQVPAVRGAVAYAPPVVVSQAFAPVSLAASEIGRAIGYAALASGAASVANTAKIVESELKSWAVPKRVPVMVPKRIPVTIPERVPIMVPKRVPIEIPAARGAEIPMLQPFTVPVAHMRETVKTAQETAQKVVTRLAVVTEGMGVGVGESLSLPVTAPLPTTEEKQRPRRIPRRKPRPWMPFERWWPVGEIERLMGRGLKFKEPKVKAPQFKMPSERKLKRMFKKACEISIKRKRKRRRR